MDVNVFISDCVVMQYHNVSSITILGNEYILRQYGASSEADIHVQMGCDVHLDVYASAIPKLREV